MQSSLIREIRGPSDFKTLFVDTNWYSITAKPRTKKKKKIPIYKRTDIVIATKM